MKTTNITANKIINLARKAERGDAGALAELQQINTYMVNNAKRRIKTIKAHTDTTPALSKLESKKVPLTKSKKIPVKELRQQVLALNSFLKSQTATYKGYKSYETKQLAALKKQGINMTATEFRTNWKDFTDSDLFKEFKEFDSESAIMEGWDAIKEELNADRLQEAWEKYKSRQMTLDEAWDYFIHPPKENEETEADIDARNPFIPVDS